MGKNYFFKYITQTSTLPFASVSFLTMVLLMKMSLVLGLTQ